MFQNDFVLLALARDRQRSIAHDAAEARRFRLRRRVAALVYALAFACAHLGAALDDDPAAEPVHV